MPDVQIRAAGPSAAPLDYVVPGAHDISIEMLSAHFDGSAAGVAWLPCIEILSDGGTSCGIIPMDAPVAAGASVEATWAPFLRGQAASTATGTAWATLTFTGANVPVAASHNAQFNVTSASFYTNTPSVFSLATNVDAGVDGILCGQNGHYAIMGQFAVGTFGAGAVDLLFQLYEGPGPISQLNSFSLAEVLSSTPIYGDGNADVAITVNMVSQVTTAGGATVPIVWNVHNSGANAATVFGYGYTVEQLDAVDQLI